MSLDKLNLRINFRNPKDITTDVIYLLIWQHYKHFTGLFEIRICRTLFKLTMNNKLILPTHGDILRRINLPRCQKLMKSPIPKIGDDVIDWIIFYILWRLPRDEVFLRIKMNKGIVIEIRINKKQIEPSRYGIILRQDLEEKEVVKAFKKALKRAPAERHLLAKQRLKLKDLLKKRKKSEDPKNPGASKA